MTFPQSQQPQVLTELYRPRVLGILGDNVTGPIHPLGIQVERATANLPQTGQVPLFTISGGRVALWILGEVTTVIQTLLNNTKLIHNVATGTDQDLCAVLDITTDEVGTLYTITGTFANALLGSGQAARLSENPVILKPGTVDLSCSASSTGQVKWTAWYIPLETLAQVVAA